MIRQAGLFAKDSVFRAREDRAASKHRAKERRANAAMLANAVEERTELVKDLFNQANMVRFWRLFI